jgi:hypothetical protein
MGMGEGGSPPMEENPSAEMGEAQRQVQAQPAMTYSRGTGAPVDKTRHRTPESFVFSMFKHWLGWSSKLYIACRYREAKSCSEAIHLMHWATIDVHPTYNKLGSCPAMSGRCTVSHSLER